MIDRYFEAYPGVRAYLDATVAEAKEHGFAETMFGRRRHIPELKARNAVQRGFGERTAMNHPMQGSAADIVHDELDFSVPRGELDQVSALVKEIMENVVDLSVPLIVDVSYGETWAEAH